MQEALEWGEGKKVTHASMSAWPQGQEAFGVALDDGSFVLAESKWTGPYSEVTPDIDGESPVFWIGEVIHSEPSPEVKKEIIEFLSKPAIFPGSWTRSSDAEG